MSEWWRGNRSFVVLLAACVPFVVLRCSFLLRFSPRIFSAQEPRLRWRSLALREQQYHQRQKHERRSARCDLETQSARSLARRKDFREASSKNLALHLHTFRSVRGRPLFPPVTAFSRRSSSERYRTTSTARTAPHRTFLPSCTLSDTNVHLSGVKPLNRSDFLGSGGFSAQGSAVLRFRYPPRFAPLSPPTYEATTARASSSRPVDEQFTARWLSVFASISDRRARSGLAGLWAYHNLFPGISRVGHTRRTPSSPSWPGLLKLSWYPC